MWKVGTSFTDRPLKIARKGAVRPVLVGAVLARLLRATGAAAVRGRTGKIRPGNRGLPLMALAAYHGQGMRRSPGMAISASRAERREGPVFPPPISVPSSGRRGT